MKLKKFLNDYANVKHENQLLKFAIVALTLMVMWSFFYIDKSVKRQKVILLPPQLSSRVVFVGDKPNKAYFEQMTRYVVSLALDYTSATARGQFAELLTLFSPEAFKKYEPVFYNLADRVQAAGNITNSFYITKIQVYPKEKKIVVTGSIYTYSASSLLTQEVCQYLIRYKIQSGRFMITEFGKIKKGAE